MARRYLLIFSATAILLSLAWFLVGTPRERRNDLWRLVRYGCVLDQQIFGRPAPCIEVDIARGFALVPGFWHTDELLLVPTRRVSGIESPALLDPATPNYWAEGWDARRHLSDGAGPVPDAWVALAVNSAHARTQDQLHIHIGCLTIAAHRALRASPLGPGWTIVEPLPGHRYLASFVPEARFRALSSFRAVAAAAGGDAASMGRQTIVVLAANNVDGPGFYLLRQPFDPATGMAGHGEELLDHRCKAFSARMGT